MPTSGLNHEIYLLMILLNRVKMKVKGHVLSSDSFNLTTV